MSIKVHLKPKYIITLYKSDKKKLIYRNMHIILVCTDNLFLNYRYLRPLANSVLMYLFMVFCSWFLSVQLKSGLLQLLKNI